jgi:hypothetical protein
MRRRREERPSSAPSAPALLALPSAALSPAAAAGQRAPGRSCASSTGSANCQARSPKEPSAPTPTSTAHTILVLVVFFFFLV